MALHLPAEIVFGLGDPDEQRCMATYSAWPGAYGGIETRLDFTHAVIERPVKGLFGTLRAKPWTQADIYVLGALVGTWNHPALWPGSTLTIEPKEDSWPTTTTT